MKFKLSGYVEDSIVDGPGMRLAVFTQGCPFRCPGCHNPQTHDPDGGTWSTTEEILALLQGNPLESGITLTGGEPFLQPEAMAILAKGAKELGKHTMAYTGFAFEELLASEEKRAALEYIDVLVDGLFIQEQRSLELRFRGSKNQRILDVPKSLAANEAVWAQWALE